jgi:hypothetical protein
MGTCISSVLCHIFNLTFTTGIIPDQLKVSQVTPIHKSEKKDNVCNYRPISVISCFSKILEKVMYTRIIHILRKITFSLKNNMVLEKNDQQPLQ